ncbi:hypothetical protein L208DRAFT_1381444 [Tricholoma matsutake]|nr:hypothetical protein L208DRAFT_1381444 [Tricholoma matsutake 945]
MTAHPSTTASSSSTAIMLGDIIRTLDQMGLMESVSSMEFYDVLLRLLSAPSPLWCPTSALRKFLHTSTVGQEVQGSSGQPSQFNTMRPGPNFFDPVRVEKCRRLWEIMKESYPDGIPQPYVVINAQSRDNLPFVRATIRMTSDDESEYQTFMDEWCLWDSGVEVSHVHGGKLSYKVKGGHNSTENGYVMGDITYVYLNFNC